MSYDNVWRPWTAEEDAVLRQGRAERIKFSVIGAQLRRSEKACKTRHSVLLDQSVRNVGGSMSADEAGSDALWRATDAWYRREAERRGVPVLDAVLTILHGADVVQRVRAA
jgi:hypothetical protein